MLILEPFVPGHVADMDLRERDRLSLAAIDPLPRTEAYAAQGAAFTARWDGVIMWCGGVVRHWSGLGECWLLTADSVTRHPIAFHRSIKFVLDDLAKRMELRRLEATVEESHGVSCRWITRLGFTLESRMPKYGPTGETHLRYARLI